MGTLGKRRRPPARRVWAWMRFSLTAAALFLVWLAFSFRLDPYSAAAGAAGALVIAALTYRVFLAEHEASLRSFMPRPIRLLLFLGRLIAEMYLASLRMAAAVVRGAPAAPGPERVSRVRVEPRVVSFRTRLRSDMARMVLANAVTFTPGTITLDLNEDHLTVHWFASHTRHAKAAGQAVKGRLEKSLGKVWI